MKYLSKIFGGLLLTVVLTSPAFCQTKIGTINLRRTFDTYWKKQDAETALKERETDIKKELNSMVSDYEKGKTEAEKLLTSANDQAISPDERDKRKQVAADKL